MKNTKLKILPLEGEKKATPSYDFPLFSSSGGKINNMLLHVEVLRGQVIANSKLSDTERQSILTELDMLRGHMVSFTAAAGSADAGFRNVFPFQQEEEEIDFPNFIGKNQKIKKLLMTAVRFAKTGYPVLITGETGVGKEVFARIIHQLSQRDKFLPVNCGAIPHALIESELFGYQKGSFTGATGCRPGKFEEADGGTIFLDEIGELDESVQVKLLRVLQFGEIQRIGFDKPVNVNVRVIAATNQQLGLLMEKGKFREDLYYRLCVCEIHVPPLRERKDEIPVLLEFFLNNISCELKMPVPQLSSELKDFLYEKYEYPGNIRELENMAKLIIALTPGGDISTVDHLTENYQNRFYGRDSIASLNSAAPAMESYEIKDGKNFLSRDGLIKQMREHKGEIKNVAKSIGLSSSRIYQLCTKYNVHPSSFKEKNI